MTNIVLLGPWCWTFLAFARTCKRQAIGAYLLEVGAKRCKWRRYSSCLAGGSSIPRDAEGTPLGIETIRRYAAEVRARAIVAADNARMLWLAGHRKVLEPDFKLLMPSEEVLRFARSKRAQIALAEEVGFRVLPTVYLTGPADCQRVAVDSYPVVLRPDRRHKGPPPFKVKVAHSRQELEKIAVEWCGVCAPIIVQPLRLLPNLVVHGARSESGEILAMTAFLVPRKYETISLTIRPTSFPPGVEKRCRELVSLAGISGCFHFELLFSPERRQTWFLEINVRLGGTTDKVTALGFDESLYLLRAYGLAPHEETSMTLNRRLAANKRDLLKQMFRAIAGRLDEIDYPAGSRTRTIRHSLRDLVLARDSLFDRSDLRGFFWKRPWKREPP